MHYIGILQTNSITLEEECSKTIQHGKVNLESFADLQETNTRSKTQQIASLHRTSTSGLS